MGGALQPKSFPWPSAIGGSQNVNPLITSQAPTSGIATAQSAIQPTQTQQSPLIPPTLNPITPVKNPVANPISQRSPLYGY